MTLWRQINSEANYSDPVARCVGGEGSRRRWLSSGNDDCFTFPPAKPIGNDRGTISVTSTFSIFLQANKQIVPSRYHLGVAMLCQGLSLNVSLSSLTDQPADGSGGKGPSRTHILQQQYNQPIMESMSST